MGVVAPKLINRKKLKEKSHSERKCKDRFVFVLVLKRCLHIRPKFGTQQHRSNKVAVAQHKVKHSESTPAMLLYNTLRVQTNKTKQTDRLEDPRLLFLGGGRHLYLRLNSALNHRPELHRQLSSHVSRACFEARREERERERESHNDN